MSLKANAEHVVAFAFQPVGPAEHRYERWTFGNACRQPRLHQHGDPVVEVVDSRDQLEALIFPIDGRAEREETTPQCVLGKSCKRLPLFDGNGDDEWRIALDLRACEVLTDETGGLGACHVISRPSDLAPRAFRCGGSGRFVPAEAAARSTTTPVAAGSRARRHRPGSRDRRLSPRDNRVEMARRSWRTNPSTPPTSDPASGRRSAGAS